MALFGNIVAIVTGGSSGLGAATARYLARNGARVVIADLSEPTSELSTLQTLAFCRTDVTIPDQVTLALDQAEGTYGEPVNLAVNCAGMAVAQKTLNSKGQSHDWESFLKVLHVNTAGTFNVARLAAERMSRRDIDENQLRGCIINTASIAGMEGQIGQVAYATSKGAILGMTLPMARDLASQGIRVMTIAPGLFETPLLDGLPDAVKAELGRSVPCPSRLGKPEEFAQLLGSIILNPMLNGSVIRLDGALRMPP